MKQWITAVLTCMVSAKASSFSPSVETMGLRSDWLDKTVSASQNFYGFANGNWQRQNPIPSNYSRWSNISILDKKILQMIQQMLIEAEKNSSAKPGSIQQKIGDFYYSGMDESRINQLGMTPLQPDFNRIESIQSLRDLQAVMTYFQSIGVDTGFNFGSMQDFMDSEQMIAAVEQGGLGLPDRDYYLKDDKKFRQVREAYLKYLAKMFQLLGDSPEQASSEAMVVMNIEKSLAEASMSKIDQRDPHRVYHMMTIAEMNKLTPHFSWMQFLNTLELKSVQRINMAMPDFFKQWDSLLQSISLKDWKIYLRSHLIQSYAAFLSKPFVDANFEMSSVITGTQSQLPRWQRVVNTENHVLGFAIGEWYVKKYFPERSKKQVLEMVENIREALKNDLQTLSWMTPETRKAALKKLDLMSTQVGYPSKWWDYSSLMIDRGPYVLNVKRARIFMFNRDLHKIGRPIDKTEWAMNPQTINAYYNPSMNIIYLPAGILQPPFFSPDYPASVNYGSIGYVVGHEITHGFDDQGAQFDGHGNLKNWWKPEDLKKFKQATQCIMDQFNQYKIEDDITIQGQLVMGEATADLGGLLLAYRAYHASKAYQNAKLIDGFTPDQQFFLGFAQSWAENIRPEQLRNFNTVDPHPPAQYRVNGTLANVPQFWTAFDVPASSPLKNQHPCTIW